MQGARTDRTIAQYDRGKRRTRDNSTRSLPHNVENGETTTTTAARPTSSIADSQENLHRSHRLRHEIITATKMEQAAKRLQTRSRSTLPRKHSFRSELPYIYIYNPDHISVNKKWGDFGKMYNRWGICHLSRVRVFRRLADALPDCERSPVCGRRMAAPPGWPIRHRHPPLSWLLDAPARNDNLESANTPSSLAFSGSQHGRRHHRMGYSRSSNYRDPPVRMAGVLQGSCALA